MENDGRRARGLAQRDGEFDLDYRIPAGFTVAGVGDGNGDGDLILRGRAGTSHRTVFLDRGHGTEVPLSLPKHRSVVGHGDLDGDGIDDLLLHDRRSNTLHARLRGPAGELGGRGDVLLGKVPHTWLLAGVMNVTGDAADTSDDVLFQDRLPGRAHAWTLGSPREVGDKITVDVGFHSNLRVYLEPARPSRQPLRVGDPRFDTGSAAAGRGGRVTSSPSPSMRDGGAAGRRAEHWDERGLRRGTTPPDSAERDRTRTADDLAPARALSPVPASGPFASLFSQRLLADGMEAEDFLDVFLSGDLNDED